MQTKTTYQDQVNTLQPNEQAEINEETKRLSLMANWVEQLERQYSLYKTAGFEFIFMLRIGVEALANNENERMNLYQTISDQIGLAVHTLQNYVSSARKPYATLAHQLGLEIGHLDAVAGLNDEAAIDALRYAGEQYMTVARFRKYVFPLKQTKLLPDVGNQNTPTADAAQRMLTSEPPYANPIHYQDDGPVNEAFWHVLDHAGNEPPIAGDELPEGYVRRSRCNWQPHFWYDADKRADLAHLIHSLTGASIADLTKAFELYLEDWTANESRDNEDFVFTPREPLAAAHKLKAVFSADEIATIVAELVDGIY